MMCHKKYRSSRLPRYFSYPFLMPNSLRKTPRRHFGLLITTTCIALPPFVVLITQYKQRDGKVCGSGLVPGQDRCIRHRFHDHQRPLAGGDDDAV